MKFKPVNNNTISLHKKLHHTYIKLFKIAKKCFCEHNKRKDSCKICNPTGFCVHGSRKLDCKECSPSSFCKHGSRKNRCKKCKPIAFCEHGSSKLDCEECISCEALLELMKES
jgi:hypothetical protein